MNNTTIKPKISVITWSGGFREYFHLLDFFNDQTIPKNHYEVIWVEYYSSASAELGNKVEGTDNARILFVNGDGDYHAGRCMNEGVKDSLGDLLVIVDGDIVVEPDFLDEVWNTHRKHDDLVLYFRRWDEHEEEHIEGVSRFSVERLDKVCRLDNPENYGGCITIRKEVLQRVGGYEEHPIFSGPGAVSKELYTRLRNSGAPIMWHPTKKVYHPWHPGSLPSTNTPQQQMQAWILKKRGLNLDTKAGRPQVEQYINDYNRMQNMNVEMGGNRPNKGLESANVEAFTITSLIRKLKTFINL